MKQIAERPLEPDAGNAAEGSEGPMPDWRFQSCDFSAHGFGFLNETQSGNQETKSNFGSILPGFNGFLIHLFFYERA